MGIYKTPISKRYVLELPTSQSVGGICGKPVVLRAQMVLPKLFSKMIFDIELHGKSKDRVLWSIEAF